MKDRALYSWVYKDVDDPSDCNMTVWSNEVPDPDGTRLAPGAVVVVERYGDYCTIRAGRPYIFSISFDDVDNAFRHAFGGPV